MPRSSVEKQLLSEEVGQLSIDDFCIVTSDTTVRDTVGRMRASKHNCAFIVGEKTQIVGIFTDRDILTKIVSEPSTWDEPIANYMTANPDTLTPEATAHEAMQMMDAGGYRNIPIIEGTTIQGNVTHFAVIKFLINHFPETVYNLPPKPNNFADARDGG